MDRARRIEAHAGRRVATVFAMFGLGFFLAGVLRSRTLLADGFMTLYAGRAISDRGIVGTDPFTIEGAGREWINQQWLAHVLYHRVYEFGGYQLVGIVSAALVGLGFAALAWLLDVRGTPPIRTLIWTSLALAIASAGFIIRAQSFAYPLFAVMLAIIVLGGFDGRFRWRHASILPLLVLWANLHGSVLLGVAMVVTWCVVNVVAAVRARSRADWGPYLLLALLAPACLLVTPYGLDIVGYYRSILFNPVISSFITEWQPATFGDLNAIPIYVFAAIVLFLYGWTRGRGIRASAGLVPMTMVLLLAALWSVRYQAWMGMAGAVLVSDLLNRSDAAASAAPHAPGIVSPRNLGIAGLALVVLTVVGIAATPDDLYLAEVPRDAVEEVADVAKADDDARILADEATGAALLWLHPSVEGRIAFDPRLELYAQDDLQRWVQFVLAVSPRWEETMDDYDVVAAFAGSDRSPIRSGHPRLVRELERFADEHPRWREIHGDDEGIVIARSGASG